MNESAPAIAEEGELIVATRSALAELDPFDSKLAEFRKRFEGCVYDLDDERQNKRARSDRHEIGKAIARLDKTHAAIKEPLLEAARLLDGRRKEIKDGLREVQGRIKSQIEAHEAKEKERLDRIHEQIERIRGLGETLRDSDADAIRAVLDGAQSIPVDADEYHEFVEDAQIAKDATVERLTALLQWREEQDAKEAELEELRKEKAEREQAEHEARLKREAEEGARAEAEAEIERQKQAVRDANARAERAKEEERARLEAEAAAKKRDEEARARKASHRKKVQAEATKSLIAATDLAPDDASAAIAAIASDIVMHVRITY